MKKLFGQYPNLRSSTRKSDPCLVTRPNIPQCHTCRVFVISDRFLRDETQLKLVGSLRKFPYVLIADTIGCNLRCWFCYSHHFWTRERAEKLNCRPQFLTPQELVDQMRCKLEKVWSSKDLMEQKPFTRIRISGGEPIYADSSVLEPYSSTNKIDYIAGIDFWLDVFEKLV